MTSRKDNLRIENSLTKSRSHGDIHRGGNIWNRVRNRLNNMVKFTPKSKQYTFKEDRSRAKNEDEHFRPVKYSLGNVATPIVSITHQLLEPVVLPSNSLFLQSGSTIQFTDNNLLHISLGQSPPIGETISKRAREELERLRQVYKNYFADVPSPQPGKKDLSLGSKCIIFGGDLIQLHRDDCKREENCGYPSVLKRMIDYLSANCLDEEGILRISGTQCRLMTLQEEIISLYKSYYKSNRRDDVEKIETIFDKYTPHDVGSLMKKFLRQLNPPLLSNELIDHFQVVPSLPTIDIQIQVLNLLVLQLDESQRNSLQALLTLLYTIARNESNNKMSLSSVALIMTPNLFPTNRPQGSPPGKSSPTKRFGWANTRGLSMSTPTIDTTGNDQLIRINNSLKVLQLMINIYPLLFHILPSLEPSSSLPLDTERC